MFSFNWFPGTNMYNLDLDWVIKTVREMHTSLNSFITNFSSPMLAYSSDDMTNRNLIYLYVGDEIGWNKDHWYYYDPDQTAWIDGGLYGSAVLDDEMDPDSPNAVRNSTLSKLIDWVTPQYYGAAGTGLVDDTAAITVALASGKPVYFPEGTYLVSGQIMVPAGSVLIGDKATIRWVTNADTTFLFGGFGLQNIEVDGLTFDFGGQTSLKYGMSFTETENVKIRNCEFLNSYGYALRLSGSSKFEVDSCVFHAITGGTGNPGGAVFATDAHDGVVSNCIAFDLYDHFAYFAGPASTYNIVVQNNNTYNSGFSGGTSGAAIVIYSNAYSCSILNNVIKNCKSGIQVSNYGSYTTVPRDILVDGCTIDTTTENGITAHGLSSSHLSNCVFKNVTMRAIGQDAVSMRYADYCTIDNIEAVTVTRYGIELSYTNHSHVSRCNIRNCAQIAVIAGNTGDCNNTMFSGINCINSSAGQTGLYIRRGNNNKVFGYYAAGFTNNYTNSATNTMLINDNASNGKWYNVSTVSSLTGTSISWNPTTDGWVSMSEEPSDNNMRYITVTDTTAGHVVATCYSSGGIRASVNFPFVGGHSYTITRNESTNSLQVQTFRLA